MKQVFQNLFLFSIISILIFTSGCQIGVQSNSMTSWTQIIISLDGQMFQIENNPKHSSWNRIYIPRDTMEEVILNQEQLDSIFKLVDSIIEKAPVPNQLVNVQFQQAATFKIFFTKQLHRSAQKTTSKEIQFDFVQSWKDLSDDTKNLQVLLARHARILK